MDFFLLVFVFNEIAAEFGVTRNTVTWAVMHSLLPAFGRGNFRAAGRQVRAPADPDAEHCGLFAVQRLHRFRHRSHYFLYRPRPVRHRHGRRLGHRRLALHGDDQSQVARRCFGLAAVRLLLRLPNRLGCLCPGVPVCRLARPVLGRLPAVAGADPLYLVRGAGIAGLRPRQGQVGVAVPGVARELEAVGLRHHHDDGLQLLQPWLAGYFS